jgi:hypothetical protein
LEQIEKWRIKNSSRQKNLADILRLIEAKPRLKEALPENLKMPLSV